MKSNSKDGYEASFNALKNIHVSLQVESNLVFRFFSLMIRYKSCWSIMVILLVYFKCTTVGAAYNKWGYSDSLGFGVLASNTKSKKLCKLHPLGPMRIQESFSHSVAVEPRQMTSSAFNEKFFNWLCKLVTMEPFTCEWWVRGAECQTS